MAGRSNAQVMLCKFLDISSLAEEKMELKRRGTTIEECKLDGCRSKSSIANGSPINMHPQVPIVKWIAQDVPINLIY